MVVADSTGERQRIKALKNKKSALSDLLGLSTQGDLVRTRFQNVAKMDAPSHLFVGLECRNGQKRLLHSLRSDTGNLLQKSTEIRQCAVAFYKKLFRMEFSAGGTAEPGEQQGSGDRWTTCRPL